MINFSVKSQEQATCTLQWYDDVSFILDQSAQLGCYRASFTETTAQG